MNNKHGCCIPAVTVQLTQDLRAYLESMKIGQQSACGKLITSRTLRYLLSLHSRGVEVLRSEWCQA